MSEKPDAHDERTLPAMGDQRAPDGALQMPPVDRTAGTGVPPVDARVS